MNIYKHEFGMNVRSVITWSIALVLVIILFLSFFSSISAQATLLNDALSQFPKELLIAFGLTNVDMTTILGFFSMIFLICQIILAIQASNYGFSMLSIEERELTADFLLTRPVGRAKILTSKFLAALTCLAITDLVLWFSCIVAINIFKGDSSYDWNTLMLLLISVVFFQLVFLTLGMLISVLVKRIRSVTTFSMALAFGMYVLSAFGGMLGESFLEWFTPFKHFDAAYIISHQTYDPKIWISLVVIPTAVVGTYLLYRRRNIPAPV